MPLIRAISLAPPSEPAVRDAGRLLAMVHELHKAGYQRIRITPGMSPSGVHWRCSITFAANVAQDGFTILDGSGGRIACYSSGQGNRYFDWPGASAMTARRLAARFLTAFPEIAAAGAGRDWPYAGWLTDVLGRAEHGTFPVFFADYPLDEEELRLWQPPPPPNSAEPPRDA